MRGALSPPAAALALLLALGGLAGRAAQAQGVRPGDEPLRVPEPAPEAPAPESLELPPLRALEPAEERRISAGLLVRVERFEITGSTVFGDAELAQAVAPYTGRTITSEELLAAREAVTQLYVRSGYVTSGATVPDQEVVDGVVRLEIVEGRLGEVEVLGNRRFRDRYFESRLMQAGRAPVSLERIEARLQLMQQDPLIERVRATLEPGAVRGVSRLVLHVEEARSYRLAAGTANDRSPAVGSTGGIVRGELANLIGLRDVWWVRAEVTSGLWEVDFRADMPVTRWDTRLRVRYRETQSEIVETPFESLDIDASSRSVGVALGQPLQRTPNDEVWLGMVFEWRQSEATLLDLPFCFQPGVTDCDPTVTVLRFPMEWAHRTSRDVVAARLMLSVGLDALGSTVSPIGAPDGVFVALLGQMQWVHVLPDWLLGTQLVARGSGQLATEPLLSIERFSVGGMNTVRGYRENQLVRDNGLVGSAELRIPVWKNASGRHLLQIVPFADVGHAWNNGLDPPINTIGSVGLGLRFAPWEWSHAEIFWGQRLSEVENPMTTAQDHGINFRVMIDAF